MSSWPDSLGVSAPPQICRWVLPDHLFRPLALKNYHFFSCLGGEIFFTCGSKFLAVSWVG